MQDLLRRVEKVWEDNCDEKDRQKRDEDAKLDDFTRAKKHTAASLRELRQQVQERDELLEAAPNSPECVRLNSQIRRGIKEVKADAERLELYYVKEQKKRKHPTAEQEEELALKAEVVDSIKTHVDEIVKQDKMRFATPETRAALMSGSGAGGGLTADGGEDGERPRKRKFSLSELEGLDVDLQDGFKQIQAKDQRIDQALDEISVGVQGLKELAVDMGEEVEKQTYMLEQVEEKVDRVQVHMNSINKKMDTTLKKTRKADKLILDFILILVLLAIGMMIFKMVKGVIDQKKKNDEEGSKK